MAVDDRHFFRINLGQDDLAKIAADHEGIVDTRLQEQALTDRMDGNLKHARKSVPFPGIEWKVVVAELEVGGIEVAEVFERIVEAGGPSAVWTREA